MEKLEESHKFRLWKNQLIQNEIEVRQIEEIYTRHNHKGEVLFSLVMLDAQTPEGNKIPPICFIKGEVVTILVCLIDKRTKEKYLLLVKQRRIADGAIAFEHPAGMVDNIKTPLQIAMQEVQEETGIKVKEHQLKPIFNEKRVFPSTGTSDECMYFFYVELELEKTEIDQYNHKTTGVASEHERIITEVLPFEKAHQLINNTNSILLSLAYLMDVGDWTLLKKLKL